MHSETEKQRAKTDVSQLVESGGHPSFWNHVQTFRSQHDPDEHFADEGREPDTAGQFP